jgi:hypothetical protein
VIRRLSGSRPGAKCNTGPISAEEKSADPRNNAARPCQKSQMEPA